MISVLAFITVKAGKRAEFIEAFKANVPNVLAEDGCIEYAPTVDVKPALPRQEVDDNSVTIIEKWDSGEALQAHLQAPHMLAFREKAVDLVEGTTIKVLQEA
ncbi:MAG: antibiotic biosynthesis monooxygenase [Candidatus Latescibacteria bacterium]|nr:antibiotic biosynthesis monooxygenase [Candidatus Latescibacterota bacterium]